MTQLTHLFSPIKIGNLELENRIVMTCANASGGGGEHVLQYYAERARGGCGLLIVGGMYTFHSGTGRIFYGVRKDITSKEEQAIRDFSLYGEEALPFLRKFVDTMREGGTKVCAQILMTYEWKRDWKTNKEGPTELVSASDGYVPARMGPARGLSVEEIKQIVGEYGDAALIAKKAGFDAIEIHAGIGYFINQFLSPHSNKRTDEYGGPMENRMRILMEIIEDCKAKAGSDYPIIARISAEDFMEGGNTLEDTKPLAVELEKAGIGAIDVETGWHETSTPMVQQWVKPGQYVYLAEEIKKVVSVPVMTAYRIWDPRHADRIVAEGRADLVGMARALVADPYLPNKALEGRFDDINYCIACCRCLDTAIAGDCPSCAVNPRVGREAVYKLEPAKEKKNVLVIGGGPSGMEAARVAALRGHDVTICDRNRRLGGALLLAGVLNPELPKFRKYMVRQVGKLPIDVRLNTNVDAAYVDKMRPDVVVVAVGGVPSKVDIAGVDRANVLSSHDMLEAMVSPPKKGGAIDRIMWLFGSLAMRYIDNPNLIRKAMKFNFPFKKRVALIGGGFAGCELADVLAEAGKKVTLIEESRRLGFDIGITTRWVVMMRLWKLGVTMERNAKVIEITDKGVKIDVEGNEKFYETDTVALTLPFTTDDKLAREIKASGYKVYSVGDCAASGGRIMEAMAAGFKAGYEV
ncbi:MAG: FAD-dependent oxidoreductase [Chloroflexota bacterium]|nr:FAD-dependent oxidoreductase [Chloroflexota bacterium]